MAEICVAGLYMKRREPNSILDWQRPCTSTALEIVEIDGFDFWLCGPHYVDLLDRLDEAGLLERRENEGPFERADPDLDATEPPAVG